MAGQMHLTYPFLSLINPSVGKYKSCFEYFNVENMRPAKKYRLHAD